MNDEQLKIFVLVADKGSFSKAEEESYISKQAMFKQIHNLEEEVETQLFIRSKTGVKLTPAGKAFYDGAQKLLKEKATLFKEVRRLGNKQSIRIGNVEHQALLDRVNEAFQQKYPEIELKRVVHPNHSGEWRVENNVQDVAETFYMDNRPETNTSYHRLMDSPYVVAMSPSHPLAKKDMISVSELTNYNLYVYPMMIDKNYMNIINEAFLGKENRLQIRKDVDNQVGIAYSCIDTKNLLLTANPFINSIIELKIVPLKEGWIREYGVMTPTEISPAIQKYIDLAKELYSSYRNQT